MGGIAPKTGRMSTVNHLIEALHAHAAPGQIAAMMQVPAREGCRSQWPNWVPQPLRDALTQRGIASPWIHQAKAADLIHHGIHTVVATGTGSGKSLAAWVPALSQLARGIAPTPPTTSSHPTATNTASAPPRYRPESNEGAETNAGLRQGPMRITYRPTVLYLAPTKALAADQFASLADLAQATDPRIGIALADGDSDADSRRWAREHADVVLSNPDFLQHVLLAQHQRWAHLWRGLSYVAIDEFHSYRGMFGAHVATTVRRALRVAHHYGAAPTVVFLSATSGDPQATAQRFLGSFGPVEAITEDGSPRGAHTLVLWRCRELEDTTSTGWGDSDPDVDLPSSEAPRRTANTEAGELTGALVRAGAQTLTFVRSRQGAERVAHIARDWTAQSSGDPTRIATYRGGYLPEDRRALEAALRRGELRALASTNALELGIDMSGLDAVVVTGWPGTHASFAQQIGRAGRAGKPGVAVFVGRDNPLDQYLLDHPEALTDSTLETNVFDPTNPYVLVPHLCAAASELPLTEGDAAVFGLTDASMFEDLTRDGMLKRRPTGWYWNTSLGVSAHDNVNLRGEGTTVSIIDADTGALLGTVDSPRADTTVYPGAIYHHQGMPYLVEALTEDVALVHEHRDEEIRTFADESTSVEILKVSEQYTTGIGTWARGEVMVSSQVTGYDIRRSSDGLYLGRVPLDMPLRSLHTAGTWWTITSEALRNTGITATELPGALHAAEHASIGILPLLATCDRCDLGGLSTAYHADTGQATVFVHDAIQGGSGCSLRGFEQGREWIRATLAVVEKCPCLRGCPRCIQSPKCGNNNAPLSKGGAIVLLRLLLTALGSASR